LTSFKKYLYAALAFAAAVLIIGNASSAYAEVMTGDEAREAVYQRMYAMSQIKWKPSTKIYYTYPEVASRQFVTSYTYYGLPYTHSMGSLERMKAVFKNYTNGILQNFVDWIPTPYTATADTNQDTIDIYMGVDCSGAISSAWSYVQPGLTFTRTSDMLPVYGNGVEYVTDYYTGTDGKAPVSLSTTSSPSYTYQVTGLNGSVISLEDMTKYFAALKKGDALLAYNPSSVTGNTFSDPVTNHVRMVVSVNLKDSSGNVISNPQTPSEFDKIDPDKSTITVIETGITHGAQIPWGSQPSNHKTSWGNADYRYASADDYTNGIKTYNTFTSLYKEYYIPVTIAAFKQEQIDTTGHVSIDDDRMGKLYLTTGTVTSEDYKLISVTMNIMTETQASSSEDPLFSQTLYTGVYQYKSYETSNTQRLYTTTMELSNFAPYVAKAGLQLGQTYVYELSAHLSNGEDVTLKTFKFVQ